MRALLVLLLLSTPAFADEDMTGLDDRTQTLARSLHDNARPHFVLGAKAFNNKDYKTSTAELEIAYRLDPEVPLLFMWAQSERLGGNCKRALELYQKYLYSEIKPEQAAFTRERIKECGGEKPAPIVIAPPPPPEHPDEPARYVWYKDIPADALTGVGAIAVVTGIVYFAKASSSASAADAAFFLDDHDRLRDTAIHQRNIGLGATIVGVLAAGAGVGLYVYHSRTATVTTDGQSVALAVRW